MRSTLTHSQMLVLALAAMAARPEDDCRLERVPIPPRRPPSNDPRTQRDREIAEHNAEVDRRKDERLLRRAQRKAAGA